MRTMRTHAAGLPASRRRTSARSAPAVARPCARRCGRPRQCPHCPEALSPRGIWRACKDQTKCCFMPRFAERRVHQAITTSSVCNTSSTYTGRRRDEVCVCGCLRHEIPCTMHPASTGAPVPEAAAAEAALRGQCCCKRSQAVTRQGQHIRALRPAANAQTQLTGLQPLASSCNSKHLSSVAAILAPAGSWRRCHTPRSACLATVHDPSLNAA